jgi:Putative threonine/serine exporter
MPPRLDALIPPVSVLVSLVGRVGRVSNAFAQLLPTLSAFLVGLIAFTVGRWLHLGEDSLRALAPPLALFSPGVAITLAVIELTTREVVSGSARLVSGFIRLAQLAFGILIATQVVGLSASELSTVPGEQVRGIGSVAGSRAIRGGPHALPRAACPFPAMADGCTVCDLFWDSSSPTSYSEATQADSVAPSLDALRDGDFAARRPRPCCCQDSGYWCRVPSD